MLLSIGLMDEKWVISSSFTGAKDNENIEGIEIVLTQINTSEMHGQAIN